MQARAPKLGGKAPTLAHRVSAIHHPRDLHASDTVTLPHLPVGRLQRYTASHDKRNTGTYSYNQVW